LPSKDELRLIYNLKVAGVVGGFEDLIRYWSSSQNPDDAWSFSMFFGRDFYGYGKSEELKVRAVRDF
jgi:hypothetical protein